MSALVERYVSAIEGVPFTAVDGSTVYLDAHTANTVEAVRSRISAEIMFELYLRIGILGAELMPDTAIDWLPRQGSIWRTPQLPASPSVGNLLVAGVAGVQVLQGTEFYLQGLDGVRWEATATVAAAAGFNQVTVPVQSETAGANTVVAGATALSLVSPNPQISAVVVDPNGLEGGTDLETIADWRSRILANIRAPAAGGDREDYEAWALDAGAIYVNVVGGWLGVGTVGVIIAMAGPIAPTPSEVAAVQAYIDGVRPVRGNCTVVAATLQSIDVQIGLNPDNTQQRALVTAAVAAFFVGQAQVGGTLYLSQLSDAISAVGGETSFLIYQPAADTQLPNNAIAVLGNLSWGAPG